MQQLVWGSLWVIVVGQPSGSLKRAKRAEQDTGSMILNPWWSSGPLQPVAVKVLCQIKTNKERSIRKGLQWVLCWVWKTRSDIVDVMAVSHSSFGNKIIQATNKSKEPLGRQQNHRLVLASWAKRTGSPNRAGVGVTERRALNGFEAQLEDIFSCYRDLFIYLFITPACIYWAAGANSSPPEPSASPRRRLTNKYLSFICQPASEEENGSEERRREGEKGEKGGTTWSFCCLGEITLITYTEMHSCLKGSTNVTA